MEGAVEKLKFTVREILTHNFYMRARVLEYCQRKQRERVSRAILWARFERAHITVYLSMRSLNSKSYTYTHLRISKKIYRRFLHVCMCVFFKTQRERKRKEENGVSLISLLVRVQSPTKTLKYYKQLNFLRKKGH